MAIEFGDLITMKKNTSINVQQMCLWKSITSIQLSENYRKKVLNKNNPKEDVIKSNTRKKKKKKNMSVYKSESVSVMFVIVASLRIFLP